MPKKPVSVPDSVSEVEEEVVVFPPPAEEEEEVQDVPAKTQRKSRVPPTRESLEQEFSELITLVDGEIEKLRGTTAKAKGVKFLRSVNKKIKTLKTHSLRISKQRSVKKRNNINSGFNKRVKISEELAEFAGWEPSELRSRADVTRYICAYIDSNNLQEPTDKRNIRVEDDPKLKKLLGFEGGSEKPVTYCTLQNYLKKHYLRDEGTASESQETLESIPEEPPARPPRKLPRESEKSKPVPPSRKK